MLVCLLAALVFSADAEPAPRMKVEASAPWRYGQADPKVAGGSQQLVLRSAAELVAATPYRDRDALPAVVEKAATADLAGQLKVKQIDWKKQMLLVVTAGTQRSGGYRVEVTGLKVKDNTLTVSWKLHPPKGFATAALTHPGVVVLVPRFTGKVLFDPPAKK